MIAYLNILISNEAIKIFILSLLPITELRFSIPYGIYKTDLSILHVVFLSIIGNIFIGILIIYIIGPIMTILDNNKYFSKLIDFIFKRTRSRGKLIYRLKFIGLIIFIGVPLPLTGVWTGSLASYLFGISKKDSVIAIILGVFISSSIVTSLSLLSKVII